VLHGSTYVEVQKDFVEVKFYCQYVVADDTYHIQGEWFEVLLCVVTYSMTVPYRLCTLHLNAVKSFNLGACYSARKDFRIGPPKISHFATLEWQKTMLEAKRRLNFDAEMQ